MRRAGDLVLDGARGFGANDFKLSLARRVLRAAMDQVAEETRT